MWKVGEPHWKYWWHIVFSGSLCGSCVSCLSERVEVVLFPWLPAGLVGVHSRGLWEHFLLSNRSILPTCIVSPWVLPSQLYKHSTRWNHCYPPLVRYKRTYLPFICRHQYPLAESILMPDHVAQLPLNIYICSYCHFIPQITWRYKCS